VSDITVGVLSRAWEVLREELGRGRARSEGISSIQCADQDSSHPSKTEGSYDNELGTFN
jgi:hypothetical protein